MRTDDETTRYVVSGFVQGVGFRMYVQAQARHLGLKGWVQNLPTGEVDVVAVGPRERLDLLNEMLWRGPVGAKVENVAAEQIDQPEIVPDSFVIRG